MKSGSRDIWVTSDLHFGHVGICKFLKDDGTKVRPWDSYEEMDEELSYVTEDSDYARLQDEIKARRVKYQVLIEEMILKKDYLLEYMDKNRRAL